MIVNHKYKFIFLKTKKTAGTSLEIALSKYCSKNDVVGFIVPEDEKERTRLGFQGPVNNVERAKNWTLRDAYRLLTGRGMPHCFPEHMKASEARKKLPREWDSYFKFTVVRDPFETIISRYFWERKNIDVELSFEDWLMKNPEKIRDNFEIYSINGKPAVDCFVRYNQLNSDLKHVSEKLGLPENVHDVMRQISAKSGVRSANTRPADMFSEFRRGRQLVEILGADDINILY